MKNFKFKNLENKIKFNSLKFIVRIKNQEN